MADSVKVKYSGPEGLAFEPIAAFNEGNPFVEKGAVYEVDEEAARYLDIFEGFSREGEESVAEQVEAYRKELGEEDKAAVRGDQESMEAFNKSAVVSDGESE